MRLDLFNVKKKQGLKILFHYLHLVVNLVLFIYTMI